MSHKNFDRVKSDYLTQGLSESAAALMAAMDTGETDGSVDINISLDTSGWSEDDWYKNNLKIGMSEEDARFSAAISAGSIDTSDKGIDY